MRSNHTTYLLAALTVTLGLSGCFGESRENLMASARKHLDGNDPKAAAIELKNLLQKEPDNAEGRFLLGKVLMEGGEMVGASVELQKAQELGYDADQVAPLLARILLNKGDAQGAVSAYAGKTLKSPQAQGELQAILAEAYIQLRKPAEAQAAVAAALAAAPENTSARLLQIRAQAGQKDFAGAMAALDKVIAAAPAHSGAHLLKGDLLMQSGQVDAALAAYREAIQRNPRNVAAHTAAIWLLLNRKDLAAAETQVQAFRKVAPQMPLIGFFNAAIAFEKGDTKTAYELVLKVLQVMPDDPTVLQLAGALELKRGQYRQAESHLGKALQIAPDRPRLRVLLGQSQLLSGEGGKAIKVLQPLVEASPPNRDALVLTAQAHRMNGDSTKAEQLFQRAAALDPNDARSRTALAMAQVGKGREEEGFESLRAISEADPGVAADLALIGTHLQRREFDSAMKAIDRLQSKQPKSPLAADLRGRAELQRGRPKEARTAFEAALSLNAAYYPAAAAIASLDAAEGKRDQARQRFEAFVKANPGDVRAALTLARLQAESGASPQDVQDGLSAAIRANPSEASLRVALVNALLEVRDAKGAVAVAQDGLNVLRDNPELTDALGRAQLLAADFNQAIAAFTRLATLVPTAPDAYLRLADVHRLRKDMTAATAALRKALEVKPNFVPALQVLMEVELTMGKRKEALATARLIQRQPGNEALGHALEGDLEWSGKNWPAAAAAYRQSIGKRPSVDVAIKLHSALLRAGQAEAAAKLEPQWTAPAFVFYLGDVALKQQRYDLARQRFEAVVQAKPDSAAALNNLAWLLNREKKPGALEMAQKAVTLAPRQAAFLDTLAEIHASRREFAKAVQIQTTAVDLAPDTPLFRLHLASYHLDNNDKAKARVELDRLEALGEKFAGSAEVKALRARL